MLPAGFQNFQAEEEESPPAVLQSAFILAGTWQSESGSSRKPATARSKVQVHDGDFMFHRQLLNREGFPNARGPSK